ncbi:helix-turn-helix transcriptional regulator [Marinoscillum furvescens]|uniref:AraC family transcriptional regulator n=1 Tax=Marinoscillum furvescens DSM 4134 TaxID=1122208 RepID=A0A3D9KYY5_MARFU|nr:helix-turn-helix transcriptional regulator [Marinoscillum furvescens]RED95259.1 AraC family transcriptional regulator [Marinoscillum furvescens DSM 4134]
MIIDHQQLKLQGKCLIERVVISPPFRFEVHFPQDACFIYLQSGTTTVNSPREQVSIKSKDGILMRCGSYFSDLSETLGEKFELIVIHLQQDLLRQVFSNDFPTIALAKGVSFASAINEEQLIQSYIAGLQYYFSHPSVVTDDLLVLKIRELVILLQQTQNAPTVASLLGSLFAPTDLDFRKTIEAHAHTNLSIADLAFLCHMSISTFKRKFKATYNESPAEYLKKNRLEKAAKLLQETTLGIGDIAHQTGFKDLPHFTKSFKTYSQQTPSEYRKFNIDPN